MNRRLHQAMVDRLRRRGVQLAIILGTIYLIAYFSRGSAIDSAPANGSYTRIFARGDGHYFFLGTLSMVFDRDVDVRNQYLIFGDPFKNGGGTQPTGYAWTYPIGTSVLQLPFFLLAHAGAVVGNAFGADIPLHGYTRWHQRVTFLGQLFAGYAAVLLGFAVARRRVAETAAFYAALFIGLGTAVFYYSAYNAGYGHAFSAFTVALLVDYFDRTRGRWDRRRWIGLGALVGLAALSRFQEVLFALLPAYEGTAELVRRLRARQLTRAAGLLGCFALAGIFALIVVSPQLMANRIIYGSPFATGESKYFMRWSAPFLWEPLFSSRNGLFVWTPLAGLAFIGLLVGVRRHARLVLLLCAVVFAQLWVDGSAWSWWSDASFSIRRMVDLTVVLVLGMAFLLDALRGLDRRFPRLARHAALLLALGPLAVMNLELSGAVVNGAQGTGTLVSPVNLYADSFRRLLAGIDAAVGIPTSWPASWWWALRHRVPPSRYNAVVGSEFLYFSSNDYRVPGKRVSERLAITPGSLPRFGAGDWGAALNERGHRFAWAGPGARLLVPLFLDEDIHFEISAAAAVAASEVQISVNGRSWSFSPATTEFGKLVIDSPPLHPGTNEIEITCDGPRPPGTGCLAVEYVDLIYLGSPKE